MQDEHVTAAEVVNRSFDEITKQQITIYAKELNEHFRNERRLRGTLHERDELLEQRAREVSALNHLLQQQLVEWYKVAKEYRDVLTAIKDVLRTGTLDQDRGVEIEDMIEAIVDGTEEADMSVLTGEAA